MTAIIPDPGSQTLYQNATPLERAHADVESLRMMAVPARLIVENIDPWKVQSGTNLLYLAYGLGVTLWEHDWPEDVRRQWLFDQYTFKSLVGTLPAYTMALATNHFDIADVITPPQGFYSSPDLTKDEIDSWIRRMPQVRIKFASKHGVAYSDEWFLAPTGLWGFSNFSDVAFDDGPVLLGREGVLRLADGTETPLEVVRQTDRAVSSLDGSTNWDRVYLPGVDKDAFYANEDTGDDPGVFAIQGNAESLIYSLRLDPGYNHIESTLSLTPVTPAFDPLSPFYERDSDFGTADLTIFAGDAGAEIDFCGTNDAPEMLADRVYLFDPSIAIPMNAGVSFANIDRVGVPRKYAELLIDLKTTDSVDAFYESDNVVGQMFAVPEDNTAQEKAFRAVVAAKALRDTIAVSFEVKRPLESTDIVTEGTRAGDWVPATL